MPFENGEYVMYGSTGICRIDGTEKRSFDGIHTAEYVRLIPYNSDNSTYYIPAETIGEKVRKLISKEDIHAIIQRIPSIEITWDNDNGKRREIFTDLLKSDNYDRLFCLIKSVYDQRQKRMASGKRLAAADEKALKAAENLMCQEFSVVLGIKPEEVTDFITAEIENICPVQ